MEKNYMSFGKEVVTVNSSPSQPLAAVEGVGNCPECGYTVRYARNDKTVACPPCASDINAKDIAPAPASASYVMDIDTPEAALVYLEGFFKTYNWEAYKQSSSIEINEISALVERLKIKAGASAAAWMLDFEAKITPFTKKIEALIEAGDIIRERCIERDYTALTAEYALYERITAAVKNGAESIFAALQTDIENASRFGADEKSSKKMKVRFNNLLSLYNDNVFDCEHIDEVPAFREAIEIRNRSVAEKFAAEGIDARATYEKAVEFYEASDNKREALYLFEAVREYGNSVEYINEINDCFLFDFKLIKLANKHFLIKRSAAPSFSLEDPAGTEQRIPLRSAKPTVSLYEVIDGKAYEPANVSGISHVLSFYGNKLFYIKRDRSICSYDILEHTETVLDLASTGDYPDEKLFWNDTKTAFYIRKKLTPERPKKKGCFKAFFSLFKRKPATLTDSKNNFAVLKVDTVNNVATVEIDRLVDITECFDNRMFYIAYPAIEVALERWISPSPAFMMCDLKTGRKAQVLGDDCHIHAVVGDNVIYTTWDPNEYNQMLFSYNIQTDVTTLIEANVFGYFATLDQRVYYTVGNKKHAPLFSNNFDGTDRIELMNGVKSVYAVKSGWVYLTGGEGRNTTLFKMSPDGSETILVCGDVAEIIELNDACTYYMNGNGALCLVGNDGKNNRVIAEDVKAESVIIDKDFVYYLRSEPVGKARDSYSLYKAELDGRAAKKLIFDVASVKNYDEGYLYVYKCATTKFIATETSNGVFEKESQVKFKISNFSIFDKKTETETHLLSVGLPNEQTHVEKRGCLKKDRKHVITYTEISRKVPYKKEGIAKVGEVYAEQTSVDGIQK